MLSPIVATAAAGDGNKPAVYAFPHVTVTSTGHTHATVNSSSAATTPSNASRGMQRSASLSAATAASTFISKLKSHRHLRRDSLGSPSDGASISPSHGGIRRRASLMSYDIMQHRGLGDYSINSATLRGAAHRRSLAVDPAGHHVVDSRYYRGFDYRLPSSSHDRDRNAKGAQGPSQRKASLGQAAAGSDASPPRAAAPRTGSVPTAVAPKIAKKVPPQRSFVLPLRPTMLKALGDTACTRFSGLIHREGDVAQLVDAAPLPVRVAAASASRIDPDPLSLSASSSASPMASPASHPPPHPPAEEGPPYVDMLRDTLFPALALALESLLHEAVRRQIALEQDRAAKGLPDPVTAALERARAASPRLASTDVRDADSDTQTLNGSTAISGPGSARPNSAGTRIGTARSRPRSGGSNRPTTPATPRLGAEGALATTTPPQKPSEPTGEYVAFASPRPTTPLSPPGRALSQSPPSNALADTTGHAPTALRVTQPTPKDAPGLPPSQGHAPSGAVHPTPSQLASRRSPPKEGARPHHDSRSQRQALAAAAAGFFASRKTFPTGPIETFLSYTDALDLLEEPWPAGGRRRSSTSSGQPAPFIARTLSVSSSRAEGGCGSIDGAAAVRFLATELRRIAKERSGAAAATGTTTPAAAGAPL